MKKSFYAVFFALTLMLCANAFAAEVAQTPVYYDKYELVVTHDKRAVELILDRTNARVLLRMPAPGSTGLENDFLVSLVDQMTSNPGRRTRLSGGYTLVFDRKYPSNEVFQDGGYFYLGFAHAVYIENGEIHIEGGE